MTSTVGVDAVAFVEVGAAVAQRNIVGAREEVGGRRNVDEGWEELRVHGASFAHLPLDRSGLGTVVSCVNGLFGIQWGVIVSRRLQSGLPA